MERAPRGRSLPPTPTVFRSSRDRNLRRGQRARRDLNRRLVDRLGLVVTTTSMEPGALPDTLNWRRRSRRSPRCSSRCRRSLHSSVAVNQHLTVRVHVGGRDVDEAFVSGSLLVSCSVAVTLTGTLTAALDCETTKELFAASNVAGQRPAKKPRRSDCRVPTPRRNRRRRCTHRRCRGRSNRSSRRRIRSRPCRRAKG